MFFLILGQILDFFKDLIIHSTVPLILGTITGFILSIVCFFFINKYVMPKIYKWIKIPCGIFMLLSMMFCGSLLGCWTSVIFPVKKILNVTFTTAENLTLGKVNALYALPKQKMDELMPNEQIGEIFDTVYDVSMESLNEVKMPKKIKGMVSDHISDEALVETVGSSVQMIKGTIAGTIHNVIWTAHQYLLWVAIGIYNKVLIGLWIFTLIVIAGFIITEYMNFAFFACCKKLVQKSKAKKLAAKEAAAQEKLTEEPEAPVEAENSEEQKKEEPESVPPLEIEYQPADLVSEAVDRSWNAAAAVDEVSTAELVDRHNRTTTE